MSKLRECLNRLLLYALAGGVALLTCACRGNDAAAKKAAAQAALAPFTQADLPRIAPSELHQAHQAKVPQCNACHASTDTSKLAADASSCQRCHAKDVPAQDVWRAHCLVCHDFTAVKNPGALQPPPKERCLLCHTVAAAGEDVFGFYGAGSKMSFACSACHQPHQAGAAFKPETCTACHGELSETRLLKQGHVNCTACHAPHAWPRLPRGGCTSCHTQPPRVIVHLIGAHPKDCLQCHSAHFSDARLRGALCQTCHTNRRYVPGRSQPAAHLACTNCHRLSNWKFSGSTACAACHKTEGKATTQPDVPAKHQQCAACHSQHNFRTTFAAACTRCHQPGAVFEHKLPFHADQQCSVCHDAHFATRPPVSGNCAGCHGAAVPSFALPAPEPHLQCENCHTPDSIAARKFVFAGTESSCRICHAVAATEPELAWDKVPSGHTTCLGCHTAHTWKVAPPETSCATCHADAVSQAAAAGMPDCTNCHAADHTQKFAGVESSCGVCHTQEAEDTAGTAKADCTLCHAPHTFKPDPASCTVCHADLPGAHSASGHAQCLNCHRMHSLKVDLSTCLICHGDKSEHFPGQACTACHSFRASK